VSLGTDGSAESVDSAIRTDSKTALRQEVIGLRAENQWLRQQVAERNSRIDELEAELKRYKNARESLKYLNY
jgi:prefoldin subunit 5